MTWYWKNEIFTQEDMPADAVGFVYCITHIKSGKRYIGQKRGFRIVVMGRVKAAEGSET
jgi:hypothetical protein